MKYDPDLSHYDARVEELIRLHGMQRSVVIGELIGEGLIGAWNLLRGAIVRSRKSYAQWRASTDAFYRGSRKQNLPYLE